MASIVTNEAVAGRAEVCRCGYCGNGPCVYMEKHGSKRKCTSTKMFKLSPDGRLCSCFVPKLVSGKILPPTKEKISSIF